MTTYAFHVMPCGGGVDYIGQVMRESSNTLRLEVVDAIFATGCGLWELSGELKDVPKSECRIFTDKLVCLEKALQINRRIYPRDSKCQ